MGVTADAVRELLVMVVDDDDDIRETLAGLLEDEGYGVAAFTQGKEALDALVGGLLPRVILLDLMMPVMDGWTFRRALLDDPALSRIPVVIMTAAGKHGMPSPPAELVLHKPLHIDRVVEVVQDHCTGQAP